MGCSSKNDISDIDYFIFKKDYNSALKTIDEGLKSDNNNFLLKYKKAEILTYLSGVNSFRIEALANAIKYGKHLKYYKSKKAKKENINKDYAISALNLYLELQKEKYNIPEEGRNEKYFYQVSGWIYLATGNISEAESMFKLSIQDGIDIWDVQKSMEYLLLEKS